MRPSALLPSVARLPQRGRRLRSTVAIGISGGVDSCVAALLLKAAGHDVIGLHMTNWDAAEEDATNAECIEREARDAKRVCEQLRIGFREVNFVREYWQDVFEPLLDGYGKGGTPNPDVACNRHIKFNHFLQHALDLGADRVATGHYARLRREDAGGSCSTDAQQQLLKAVDGSKDQSYFLAMVRQGGLNKALFPLGHLHKSDVRALATAAGLHPASKRDSMGICFIGKRDFGDFLTGYLPQASGKFVCVESGRTIGEHKGYALYTPGQRARVGGMRNSWYVVGKDVEENLVWVCEGRDHPALFTRSLETEPPHWIAGEGVHPSGLATINAPMRCEVRVRHPGVLHTCTVERVDAAGTLRVSFDRPIQDVAPLQAMALYDGEVCLGGAIIKARGPTLYEEQNGHQRRVSFADRGQLLTSTLAAPCVDKDMSDVEARRLELDARFRLSGYGVSVDTWKSR